MLAVMNKRNGTGSVANFVSLEETHLVTILAPFVVLVVKVL